MHPKKSVKIKWGKNFSYVIGLIVTDGNLSKDGRHIIFTSKDLELINNFQKGLKINFDIKKKNSGSNPKKIYNYIQISDVNFYRFLLKIGLMPFKSKILHKILVPKKYFFDFLRGCFDGDGSFYSYWDKRWRSSYMFYTSFASASYKHVLWLQKEIGDLLKIFGHITKAKNSSCYQLRYAKTESLVLFKKMYKDKCGLCLKRKYLKIIKQLDILKK